MAISEDTFFLDRTFEGTLQQHIQSLVAEGILEALSEVKTNVPMVVRLVGTNASEGRQLLKDAEMETADTLAEAAEMAVKAAKV